MSLFSRKPAKVAEPETTLIEVRSMHGVSFHIVDTAAGENLMQIPALCGYTDWVHSNTSAPVTAEKVRASLPNQHAGWRWCSGCASAILGE